MSFTVGNSNTATSPVTGARSLVPEPINFGADFRVVKESANEVVLANLVAPLGQPEKIRIAWTEVPDVFKGSDLDPPSTSTNGALKKGCSILVQMTGVGSDGSALYPYSAHLVLKVPYGPSTSAANIITMVQRLLGTLYATQATTPNTRLESLMRGAITPTEL